MAKRISRCAVCGHKAEQPLFNTDLVICSNGRCSVNEDTAMTLERWESFHGLIRSVNRAACEYPPIRKALASFDRAFGVKGR